MIIKLPVSYREEILTAKPPSNDEAYPDQNYPDYLYSEAGVGHIPTRHPDYSRDVARAAKWTFHFTWALFFFAAGFLAGAGAVAANIWGWI